MVLELHDLKSNCNFPGLIAGVMYVYLLGLAVSNLCVLIIAIPALISITSPACSDSIGI